MKSIHFTLEEFDTFCRVTMKTPVRTQRKVFRKGVYSSMKRNAMEWIKQQVASRREAEALDAVGGSDIYLNGLKFGGE